MGSHSLGRRTGLMVIGALLIVGGILLPFLYYTYNYNIISGAVVSYEFPLLPYGVAVAILGVIVAVIGLVTKDEPQYEPASPSSPLPAPPTLNRYCRFCGAENKSDAIFCEKCGKQIT